MFRVTSLSRMDDRQLNRWIKRLALLLVVGSVLFTAFYFFDRWRPAPRRRSSTSSSPPWSRPSATSRTTSRRAASLPTRTSRKGRFQDAIDQYDLILKTGKDEELATFGRAAAYMGL